jgi:transcriptional regulator with XRE-family HTH domain
MKLGDKIKRLRKMKDLTLDDINHKTGVGKATLSRIENNITEGTVKTLLKICSALDVDIKQLYEDIDSSGSQEEPGYIPKANELPPILPQVININQGTETVLLKGKKNSGKFLYCLDGSVEVVLDENRHQLNKGIGLYFSGSASIKNIGKSTARCLVVSGAVEF